MASRVSATNDAIALIDELVSRHGPVVFHQSGGCCDGSAPMCFPRDEFKVGSQDIFLGEIAAQPFFISESQFAYWEHTHLMIDVVPGRGGMFSLEGSTGKRFLTRSRLYDEDEWAALEDTPVLKAYEVSGFEGLQTTS